LLDERSRRSTTPVLATVTRTMRARLVLATILALLAPAATALASGTDVIRDCTDDEVMSKTYTQKEYRAALRELAADADQYGNCRDVILRAQQAALAAGKSKDRTNAGGIAGGRGSNTGGGAGAIGSAPAADQLQSASEKERRAVERARTTRSSPVALDNATVDPAKVGTAPGVSQVSDLPTPLAVLLVLLVAGMLAVAGLRLRRLVHARRA
jgi:hypothetical protein